MKTLIKDFLFKHNIQLSNETVCIGISTGVDSSVLLHLLMEFQKEVQFNIVLCHVNHGKREQSIIEEQYIIQFSKDNNLNLEVLHLNLEDIKEENFQSAARMKRLQFFNDVMNKYKSKYLFLAHHLNDDIETSLMHIIRGSSLQGYAGIKEVVYNNDNKVILRPLLSVLKEDIIKYSNDNNIKYFEDESNLSDSYTRNRIRHHLIPLLFEENENFEKQFLEFKETLLNSYQIVCEKRDQFIKNNVIVDKNIIKFNINAFNNVTDYLKTEILFEVLKKYQFSKKNIQEIIKLIYSSKANLLIDYKNISFCKQYDSIIISDKLDKKSDEVVNILIDSLGIFDINDKYYLEVVEYSAEEHKKNQIYITNLNVIWYNKSMLPLILRNRREGDRIKIGSGTKKVKDLLIDEKIPTNKRDELLMLVKDKQVLNIFGIKKSQVILDSINNNILIILREKN